MTPTGPFAPWFTTGNASTPAGRALLQEQFHVLKKQIPIACAVVFFSTLSGIGYGIPENAHFILKTGVPTALLAATAWRMLHWVRLQNTTPTPEEALIHFRRARILAALLNIGFCVWGLLLFEHADLGREAFISVFVFLTAIGYAYCLTTLPSIAVLSLLFCALPMTLRLLISGHAILVCMGLNFALILALVFKMLNACFNDFLHLVSSRAEILAQRERARRAEALAIAEQSKAKEIANTDALTDLPNRRAFITRLNEMMLERRTEGAGFTVAVLDLDGFKPINDSFGHHVGDQILMQAGERLSSIADPDDVVARLGGDEFAILLSSLRCGRSVEEKGQEFCQALALPFEVGEAKVRLSGSCGLALFPEGGSDPAQLLERADTALYHVKRNGRSGVALFSHDMENHLRRRSLIEQAVRLSPAQNKFTLLFQPIVDLRTSRLRSFEALARWTDDQLGPVSPIEFISAAEQTGVIGELTDILFRKAVAQARAWHPTVALSFNLSALQLCSPATPLKLISIMSQHGFDPRRLEIEITETALLVDFKSARDTIGVLRAAGVGIILDDFGAGYSSIGYLREMAFDMIKIDGAIVEPIVLSDSGRALLKGVLELCSAIGASCIAEKVETSAHVRLLRELDCQCAQGHAFAKPMPAQEALQLSVNQGAALRAAMR